MNILNYLVGLLNDTMYYALILTSFSCVNQSNNKNLTQVYTQLADSVLFDTDSIGNSYLHNAVLDSDTAFVNILLKKGLDINAKNNLGNTPMHLAAEIGDTVMIRLLLFNNANIHALNHEQNTPLFLAVKNNDVQTAESLYFNEAYTDAFTRNKEEINPTEYAIRNRYYSIAELLYWPMHYIVKRDKRTYFNFLVQVNPEYINKKDMKGMTPLHNAYLYKNNYFVEKLIIAGSDPNALDNFNRKPDEYSDWIFGPMIEKNSLSDNSTSKVEDRMLDFLVHYNWMTVGLIKDGEIVYLRCYGNKNMINEDAVYASVSKVITSAIFVQLLDEGIIKNLDENISNYSNKYSDAMPDRYKKDSITFKHLLTHRSGIPHIDKQLWINSKLNLQFKPGSEFLYTTNGFGVLGEIMEEITGKTYSELVKQYIGEPVGAGSFWAEDHFRAPGARVHSTSGDFARFALGILNNNYMSANTFNDIVIADYEGVGLGWGCNNFNTDDITMMHAGSNGKPRAYILLKPKKELGVVLMGDCNTKDDIWFIHLGPILMDIMEGKGSY